MKKVLITSTGSVACGIVIRNLKKMGYYLIGCNLYPKEWVIESCQVDEFFQAPPVSDEEAYIDFIQKLCCSEGVNFVFPMIDYEVDVFNHHRDWVEKHGIILCISPKKAIDLIRDKKKLQDFAKIYCPEVNPIPTYLANDYPYQNTSYPIVCKPYNGRSSQGLKIINSAEKFHFFLENEDTSGYIAEPFINGPIVMVETIRQERPEKIITLVRRELISTPHGCSITVYVYEDQKLQEYTKKLASLLGVVGDVNFEYILDGEGKYHLVECNPRFSAGAEFACISGYDCVSNHIRCFQNQQIEDYHFRNNMVISRNYQPQITAANIEVPYSLTNH